MSIPTQQPDDAPATEATAETAVRPPGNALSAASRRPRSSGVLLEKLETVRFPLRPDPSLFRKGALAATAAVFNTILLGGAAHAQAPAQDQAAPPGPKPGTQTPLPATLPEVVVTGSEGYRADHLSLQKNTEPLLTTPQSAAVVTGQLMKDEGVSSLQDALRNVSGVSIGAGEGSYQGDNFSIRGFAARSDIYLDGMSDFGSYDRDPFNTEQIEVLKGPSSAEFGRGSSGGVVNMESKTPQLTPFVAGSVQYGTDNTHRGTIDFNEPISQLPGAAFRLNLMGHDNDVTGRSGASYSRWGIAPSLALGLGTDTRFTISYMTQHEDNTPDYGIPWLFDRPANVPRSNFYGFLGSNSDYLITDVNIGTIKFEHDFNEHFTLRENFRLASYYRDFRISQADTGDLLPGQSLTKAQVARDIIDGVSTDRDIDEDINLLSKFDTGPISHTLVTGFEYLHQSVDPRRIEPTWMNVPGTSLLNPNNLASFTGTGTTGTEVNATVQQVSLYMIDTMKFGKQWSLIGSVRYDHISSYYNESIAPASGFSVENDLPSWRAALVYQPQPNGSIYLASGTSVHPNVQQLSLSSEPALPNTLKNEAIGRNFEVELGTKWDVFDRKLSLNAAVFWDEQTNAAPVDLDDPLVYVTDGKERVIGFEVGATGHLTSKWQMLINYTYQDGEVTSSSIPSMVGEPILNAPRSTFSLWTTYDLPWNFQVGFGVNGVSRRAASEEPDPNGLIMQAKGYIIYSAMLKYQISKNVDIQANVTNLTDDYYYDGVHPGHVVPGEGRTLFISTNFKF